MKRLLIGQSAVAAHFSLQDLSGVYLTVVQAHGTSLVAVMNTGVGLVMIVWTHKERTTHWLGQGTRGSSFGGGLNPVTKVFQERNRKPVSRNRFPVSLLKYLSNRVQIVAKTIGVINLAHLRTNPFDFNPILLLDGRYTPQEAYVRATNGHCALKRPKMAKNARLSNSKISFFTQ